MASDEICFLTATKLAALVRSKELSCREVMRAHLEQIDRVNPTVNAIVTLLPERAMEQLTNRASPLGTGIAAARRVQNVGNVARSSARPARTSIGKKRETRERNVNTAPP